MEKSSEVNLTPYEVKQIKGQVSLEKRADGSDPRVPERMVGWYSLDELKVIADNQ